MSIKLVTGTTEAPVALSTALRHVQALQQDVDMVWLYLQAATEKIEDYLGRSLVTKTFCLNLADWPCVYDEGVRLGRMSGINLNRTPLVAVDHVKYYYNGQLLTWASSNYRVDVASTPGRLVFSDSATFPSIDYRPDAIQIQFQAGYGSSPSAIPAVLRTAVLSLTRHWFDHRVPVITGTIATELPQTLQYILRAYRVEATP